MVGNKEQISSLMDGELTLAEQSALLRRLRDDQDAFDRWDTYHRIGEALRRDPLPQMDLSLRIRAALDAEPTVLAPGRGLVPEPAARSHWVGRTSLAAAAAVAAFSIVAFVMGNGSAIAPPGPNSNLAGVAPGLSGSGGISLVRLNSGAMRTTGDMEKVDPPSYRFEGGPLKAVADSQ